MKETKIAVAFLDLLGFSQLLKMSTEVADDTLDWVRREVWTRYIDQNAHPIKEYEDKFPDDKKLLNFVVNSEVSSFKYLVNFSDSLILGAENVSLFVNQLSNLVFTLCSESFKPFAAPFDDLYNVYSMKYFSVENNKTIRRHKAFPVLFRGGVSYGSEASFFNEFYIQNEKLYNIGYGVSGKTYLKAVKLEEYGKGARLFCDKSLVDSLEDKSFIRIVNKNDKIYEIVWFGKMIKKTQYPYDIFSDPFDDLNQAFTATINLVKYYEKTEPEVLPHYKESLKLICRGIVRHVDIYHDRKGVEDITESINKRLERNGLEKFTAEDLLDGFL